MTQLKLEVFQTNDLSLLLSLCQRLGIRVVEQTELPLVNPRPISEEDGRLILAGVPIRKDFSSFVTDFEASRQDRAR